MEFLNLNESVLSAIRIAQGIAREYGNEVYTPSHLLLTILHKEIGLHGFIQAIGADLGYLQEWAEVRIEDCPRTGNTGEVKAGEKIPDIMEQADNVRLKWGLFEVNPLCVLSALTRPGIGYSPGELKSFPIREKDMDELFTTGSEVAEAVREFAPDTNTLPVVHTAIGKYCIDKSQLAAAGSIYPVVNRERESRMMMEILGRHSKPNVLIIGDSGVGKTALVDGLACSIHAGDVPSCLEGAIIFELDNGALIAGATYKGEIEDRLKGVIKELQQIDGAILFIDEIHTLLDPKQGNNGAAGILKPELSKGFLTVIGATTVDEYRKLIEPDHAFSRRFEVLQVHEPDIPATIEMVRSVLERYTTFHKVEIEKEALSECVALAKRYVKERRLPDAAIDLLDRTLSAIKMINETAAKDIQFFLKQLAAIEEETEKTDSERIEKLRLVHLSMKNRLSPVLMGSLTNGADPETFETVRQWMDYLFDNLSTLQEITREKIERANHHHLASIIAGATGIPVGKIESGEKEKLVNLEELLRQRVVGQDNALKSLGDAIVESRSGMNKAGQPIGSFFLLGPTGTGKTELAKALAEVLFNDEKAMIRFDMSEFKEEHSAALLYGAPPGYVGYEEGGLLVNKIRQQPYAVVLFDEIEKAHPSVYNIFLQIMDEGKLHDRLGKEGDFSNAIVLFTSNVGSEWLTQQINAGRQPETTELMEVMASYFRPEFLARLSEIVPFSPINEEMLIRIFEIQMRDVGKLLEKKEIRLKITEEAKKQLAHKGFTPKYGARQIAGTIRNSIRRPISKMLIGGKVKNGETISLSLDTDNNFMWDVKE